ncbi:MAG: hypothetical protein JWM47_77 [Acidimicrobiales bacterium]|nr:hypothetical protein [Acidimicrobiales bacterium]
MLTIGIASGYTSQNIGNAFFQLGGAAQVARAAQLAGREVRVTFVPDVPGNWTLRRKGNGSPPAHFDVLRHTEGLDLLVIQGPSLSWFVNDFWTDALADLRARGTQVALIGIAFYRFDQAEIDQARRFLDANPVLAISTRDSRSATLLREMVGEKPVVHDGLDSGFWLPHAHTPLPLAGGPYLALTFDRFVEPRITADPDPERLIRMEPDDRLARLANRIARQGKAKAYAAALLDRSERPARIGDHTVIRPEHRSNPPMHWKAYGRPNGLMADEPYSYLSVYAAAELTVSDRVHACVAALAYGNRAVILNETPRGRLLDRVAPAGTPDGLRRVDPHELDRERAAQECFVADHVIGAL